MLARIGLHEHAFSEQSRCRVAARFLAPSPCRDQTLVGKLHICWRSLDESLRFNPKAQPAHLSLDRVPICARLSCYLTCIFSYILSLSPLLTTLLTSVSIVGSFLRCLCCPLFHYTPSRQPSPRPNSAQQHPPPACIHRRPALTVIPALLAYSPCSHPRLILPPCRTPLAAPPPSSPRVVKSRLSERRPACNSNTTSTELARDEGTPLTSPGTGAVNARMFLYWLTASWSTSDGGSK